MIRNGIIFTGLMVATSAAGFALSFSHDAVTKNRMMSMAASADTAPLAAPAFVAAPKVTPVTVADSVPSSQTAQEIAPKAVLAQGHAAPRPVLSSQASPVQNDVAQQELTQRDLAQPDLSTPVVRPRMRDDAIAMGPVLRNSDTRPLTSPLPLSMPAHSFDANRSTRPTPVLRPTMGPAPRYLIGVYR